MAASKYLARLGAGLKEITATVTGGTVTQAGAIPALDDTGRLDISILPVKVGQDVQMMTAGAALTAGDFVGITATGPQRASAASGGSQLKAEAFVLDTVASGAQVAVYFDGTNTALTGLTLGDELFLSATTPGRVTSTPLADTGQAGKLHQSVARSVSTTAATFSPGDPVTLA